MRILGGDSQGILMVATGIKHIDEAILSMGENREYLGNLPITIFTNEPQAFSRLPYVRALQLAECRFSYRDKIAALSSLIYEKTIFLDTDTRVVGDISDLFLMLEYYDFCGAHAPVRWAQWKDRTVPAAFPEVNSGVMCFRRNRRTRSLIKNWLKIYDDVGVSFDQASLRSALWLGISRGKLQVQILPPEYNLRTTKPWLAGPGLAVRIIHGRVNDETMGNLRFYLNTDISKFRGSSQFPTGQNAHPAKWSASTTKRYFVTGVGRSGTSLVAGLFRYTSFDLGKDSYPKRDTNPLGFFEDRRVNDVNETILHECFGVESEKVGHGWLLGIEQKRPTASCSRETREILEQSLSSKATLLKDPRFCYTLQFWIEAALDIDSSADIRLVCVFRDPGVVIASIQKELASAPYLRGLHLSEIDLFNIWCAHYQFFLDVYANSWPTLFIHYDDILDGTGLDVLESFTDCEVDRSFVQKGLRRSRSKTTDISKEAKMLYSELLSRKGI